MRHMAKVQRAALAAAESTGDAQATCRIDYEHLLGYSIRIRWNYLGQGMGMHLVISEARAGSDTYLARSITRDIHDLIEEAKSK